MGEFRLWSWDRLARDLRRDTVDHFPGTEPSRTVQYRCQGNSGVMNSLCSKAGVYLMGEWMTGYEDPDFAAVVAKYSGITLLVDRREKGPN